MPPTLRWPCRFALWMGLFCSCSPATDTRPRTNGGSDSGSGGAAQQGSTNGGSGQVSTSGGSTGIINVVVPGDCGHQNFQVAQKPANVLLVLDRSASMVENSNPTKWSVVVPTLQAVISATNSSISWGLKVFPEGTAGQCTAATNPLGLKVPIAPNNADKVNAEIGITQPTGNGTPTASAINEAVKDLQAVSSSDPKYILLATDGEPSCSTSFTGSTDSTGARTQGIAAVTAAYNGGLGYPVFVVGVTTPDKQSALDSLNSMAVAGGRPVSDPNPLAAKYYLAVTSGELQAALTAITATVATCSFDLSSTPPDKDLVNVYIGPNNPIHHDPTAVDGWHYSPPTSNTIQLYGSACEQVRTLGTQSVDVVFVCPTDILY